MTKPQLHKKKCDNVNSGNHNNITLFFKCLASIGCLVGFIVGHATLQSLQHQSAANVPMAMESLQQQPHNQQGLRKSTSSFTSQKLLLSSTEMDPWKKEHYARIDRVRAKCGPLCEINDLQAYKTKGTQTPGKAYSTFSTPVNCQALFEMEEIDNGDTTLPYPIPAELLEWYSLHGAVNIKYHGKLGQNYLNSQAEENVWTQKRIEEDLASLRQGRLEGTYGIAETTKVRDRLMTQGGLQGQSVLVVGSQRPWLETVALYAGAAKVTTLEYGAIQSQHPLVSAITPSEFRQAYLNNQLPKYDAILSYSSLEHSGLGRYGDALNPWGDILSLARCWCVAKDDALLLLGVPVGPDAVEFNAHRMYGNVRMPLLTTNWSPSDGAKDYAKVTTNLGLHFFRKVAQR